MSSSSIVNSENESKYEEIENNKIALMRASLQAKLPNFMEVDESTMRRFLNARDSDIEKGTEMLVKFLKWRDEFVPNGSISPSQVPNEIAHNKVFLQGLDKHGRPIVVLLGSRHFQNKHSLDELKRFTVCCLDKITTRMRNGQEKFVVIVDLKGWGYANCDVRGYLAALSILQDYYPERLGKFYAVRVPYIFMATWKIIYPFIDNNTRKKIVFVESDKLKSTLLEDIDESQIPDIYGGQMPLFPILHI